MYSFFKVFGAICIRHESIHWLWHDCVQKSSLALSNAVAVCLFSECIIVMFKFIISH
jgi:hypothetical protein